MPSALEMFRETAIHLKLLPKTRKDYSAELLKFHRFTGTPSSQWKPPDVRRQPDGLRQPPRASGFGI